MIYPLLPVYLSRVLGAGAMSLGVIEGVAEGINSLLKIISGYWSDRARRKPIVIGDELQQAVDALGDAFDHAQRHCAGAEHAREIHRQERIDHFRASIGEEARPPEQPDWTRNLGHLLGSRLPEYRTIK